MAIVTVGIDLAKNVFAVHGVDETGKPALLRPEVPRAKLLELMANLPPCLIGMEACSGGLLSELGIVLPLKAATLRREAHKHLEDLPGWCNTVVGDALSELIRLDERIKQYDQHIEQAAKEDERSRQLMQLAGVGPTTASAIVATVGKGHDFTCGRQFCAWLGLVPGQYSSGGKQRLGRITKAGDPYLRTLLIMGGKAVLAAAKNKTDPVSRWAISVQERRGYWKAVVAIAAKNARMCWAMLQRGEAFKLPA